MTTFDPTNVDPTIPVIVAPPAGPVASSGASTNDLAAARAAWQHFEDEGFEVKLWTKSGARLYLRRKSRECGYVAFENGEVKTSILDRQNAVDSALRAAGLR
jgi:hypothetical protein